MKNSFIVVALSLFVIISGCSNTKPTMKSGDNFNTIHSDWKGVMECALLGTRDQWTEEGLVVKTLDMTCSDGNCNSTFKCVKN